MRYNSESLEIKDLRSGNYVLFKDIIQKAVNMVNLKSIPRLLTHHRVPLDEISG